MLICDRMMMMGAPPGYAASAAMASTSRHHHHHSTGSRIVRTTKNFSYTCSVLGFGTCCIMVLGLAIIFPVMFTVGFVSQ